VLVVYFDAAATGRRTVSNQSTYL